MALSEDPIRIELAKIKRIQSTKRILLSSLIISNASTIVLIIIPYSINQKLSDIIYNISKYTVIDFLTNRISLLNWILYSNSNNPISMYFFSFYHLVIWILQIILFLFTVAISCLWTYKFSTSRPLETNILNTKQLSILGVTGVESLQNSGGGGGGGSRTSVNNSRSAAADSNSNASTSSIRTSPFSRRNNYSSSSPSTSSASSPSIRWQQKQQQTATPYNPANYDKKLAEDVWDSASQPYSGSNNYSSGGGGISGGGIGSGGGSVGGSGGIGHSPFHHQSPGSQYHGHHGHHLLGAQGQGGSYLQQQFASSQSHYNPSPINEYNSPGRSLSEVVGRGFSGKSAFRESNALDHFVSISYIHSEWVEALDNFLKDALVKKVSNFYSYVDDIIRFLQEKGVSKVFQESNQPAFGGGGGGGAFGFGGGLGLGAGAAGGAFNLGGGGNQRSNDENLNRIRKLLLLEIDKFKSSGSPSDQYYDLENIIKKISHILISDPSDKSRKYLKIVENYTRLCSFFRSPSSESQSLGVGTHKKEYVQRVKDLHTRIRDFGSKPALDFDIIIGTFLNECENDQYKQDSIAFSLRHYVTDLKDFEFSPERFASSDNCAIFGILRQNISGISTGSSYSNSKNNGGKFQFAVFRAEDRTVETLHVEEGRENFLECIILLLLFVIKDQQEKTIPLHVLKNVFADVPGVAGSKKISSLFSAFRREFSRDF